MLSRVEGRPTVGEIIGVSGLGAAQTEKILEKLIELGALTQVQGGARSPTASSPRVGAADRRAKAEDRRRRLLRQQLGARTRSPTQAPAVKAQPVAAPPPPPPDPEAGPVLVDPVAPDDPRLDDGLGLALFDQRIMLALDDQRETLSPFELLGISPTDDIKDIHQAFREASRRFHPDAYHGRALGPFAQILSRLFVDAKAAHAALQRAEVRAPFVEQRQARAEARRQEEAKRREAAAAAQAERVRREQEQAKERRAQRATERADRERQRLAKARQGKIDELMAAAVEAEGVENFARAANNYRLALQIDPSDEHIRTRWESVRTRARRIRAKDAFSRACTLVELGHGAEATPLFVEAADADPSAEHLAWAADAVREQDSVKAREFAMAALRVMGEGGDKASAKRRPNVEADLRLKIGRAFLAAGQAQSARQQAVLVQRLRPQDPQARALLKSAKVT